MTSTALQVFDFEGNPVRTVLGADGEPWWVLADVCRVLEIGNPSDAASRLDDDERATLDNTEGRPGHGARSFTIVNESGLYCLILTSRKPAAKRFRKWVTGEVLPSLRRTGRYETQDPELANDEVLMALDQIRRNRLVTLDLKRRMAEAEAKAADALHKADAALVTLTGDTGFVSLAGYCRIARIPLSRAELAAEGKWLSSRCRNADVPVKQVHSEVFGFVNAYPDWALREWETAYRHRATERHGGGHDR